MKLNVLEKYKKGFTLIELLITIAILATLSTVTVIIINPTEFIKAGRDATRLSDLSALHNSLSMLLADNFDTDFGDANNIYISIPDTSETCANLSLPTLPDGYFYHCVSTTTLRNVDGSGWVPVDLTTFSAGAPISVLPIDPINTTSTSEYYTYIPGGSWELTAFFESTKHLINGSLDGGDSIAFEIGNDLNLSPMLKTTYSFDDFPKTTSNDGSMRWWNRSGYGVVSLSSDDDGAYVRVSGGHVWYEWQENIPFNPSVLYKISCRVRQVVDPTSGGKLIYCGVAGVAANGSTMINTSGSNSHSGQHYIAASGRSLTAGAGYTTFTGYFSGNGTPAGGQHQSMDNPAKLYPGVAYFRPIFLLNYSGGNGIADIEMEIVEIVE